MQKKIQRNSPSTISFKTHSLHDVAVIISRGVREGNRILLRIYIWVGFIFSQRTVEANHRSGVISSSFGVFSTV